MDTYTHEVHINIQIIYVIIVLYNYYVKMLIAGLAKKEMKLFFFIILLFITEGVKSIQSLSDNSSGLLQFRDSIQKFVNGGGGGGGGKGWRGEVKGEGSKIIL